MPAAGPPNNEPDRLAALGRVEPLAETAKLAFDGIVKAAAEAAAAPMALITFVTADALWFKASVGLSATQTPRDAAFCAWAIHDAQVMWVEDASVDPRFDDNPLVLTEPHIRAYAGAPISTPDGYLLGTVCVLDHQPRAFDATIAGRLEELASKASAAMTKSPAGDPARETVITAGATRS